jgi:UPF0271 protein
MTLDINCDLGEGEPLEKTELLLKFVTSVNIACGGHAGDEQSMLMTSERAVGLDVFIGAHPGLSGSFGRMPSVVDHIQFLDLLNAQLSSLDSIVRKVGGQLHHVKLHGALYHLSDADEVIAGSYLNYLRENWPDLVIYARSNGLVHEMAETIGLEVWPEGFLDRSYNDDGTLVSRTHPNASLSRDLFLVRLDQVTAQRPIQGTTGRAVRILPRTWCIHSDSPDATSLAEKARERFSDYGLTLPVIHR